MVYNNIQNKSNKSRAAGVTRRILTACTHSPSRLENLTSRCLFAVCQQQAAPTAVWVEAWGERSLIVASIPDLQLSLCHYPMSHCCCSVLLSAVGGGRGLIL